MSSLCYTFFNFGYLKKGIINPRKCTHLHTKNIYRTRQKVKDHLKYQYFALFVS
jgi:hypothetical protein